MVEPQDLGELKAGLGAPLLHVLEARVGQPTLVRMVDGTIHTVFDGSGWGRDLGDTWEHLTAILGPDPAAEAVFFYMSDVECLIDPDTHVVLASQKPAPGET